MDASNPNKPMYGPWLEVPAVKKLVAQPKKMVVKGGEEKTKREETLGSSAEQVAEFKDENRKSKHALENEA